MNTLPAGPVAAFDTTALAELDLVLRAEEVRRRARLAVQMFVAGVFTLFMASVFAPCFMPDRCRSQQSEAKGNLKALYVAQESYRAEFDAYNLDTGAIGFEPKGAKVRYRYVVTDIDEAAAPDRQHFRAWAFRIDGERDDLWTIDDEKNLQNVVNGCEQ